MPARVLWLIKGLGLGGAEKLLALAAQHLDRSRFDVEAAFLLPWKTALVEDLRAAGVPTTCLNHTHPFDLRIIGRIARFARERRFDLLHLHLPYTGIVGRLAARWAGTPGVIYTEHNVQERYHVITRLANQATIGLCDMVIAVSDEVRESLLHSPLARRARVRTIRNGVDAAGLREAASGGLRVREELAIPADHLIVGVVNVFRPQKRLDLWIQAARLIADAEPRSTFVLVGDGPSLSAMQALADRMGLNGQMRFTGLRRDAPRLIAAFDVFMLASVYEGLPVAVLEAMALGRPIVATRVGGLPGVVQDGHHGFLVAAGDPAALAGQVVTLLRNPELRRAMGEASAQHVLQHFSIRQMIRTMEQVYTEILDAKGRGERPQSARSVAT